MPVVASRRQFTAYREKIRKRKAGEIPDDSGAPRRGKTRSSGRLFVEFWRLLAGHRRAVVFALCTLTVATALRLIPPAATKIAVDFVLPADARLPESLINIVGSNRLHVLMFLALGVLAISLIATALHLWGRWHATRTVNRVQVD
jgi:ATP-binding cassette subfamily B protein/subfamily B ATP-binding cassette protein MsbA